MRKERRCQKGLAKGGLDMERWGMVPTKTSGALHVSLSLASWVTAASFWAFLNPRFFVCNFMVLTKNSQAHCLTCSGLCLVATYDHLIWMQSASLSILIISHTFTLFFLIACGTQHGRYFLSIVFLPDHYTTPKREKNLFIWFIVVSWLHIMVTGT